MERTSGEFSKRALSKYPGQTRWAPIFCKTSEIHAFLIGGKHDVIEGWRRAGCIGLKSCLRFDLAKDTWEEMPSMQEDRREASSCALAGYLYVFCGHKHGRYNLNSIEKLQLVDSASEQNQQVWQLIPTSNLASDFTARKSPVACPLNKTQILIMGGQTDYNSYTNDVFIFDSESDQVKKVAGEAAEKITFWATGNACAAVNEEKVVALVRGNDSKPYLIKYTMGSRSISLIQSFY